MYFFFQVPLARSNSNKSESSSSLVLPPSRRSFFSEPKIAATADILADGMSPRKEIFLKLIFGSIVGNFGAGSCMVRLGVELIGKSGETGVFAYSQ